MKTFSHPLKEIICKICNKSFLFRPTNTQPTRTYCNRKCAAIGYKTIQTVDCSVCKKKFGKIPSAVKRYPIHYCSKICQHKGASIKRFKPRVHLKCGECSKPITRRPLQMLKQKYHFCSKSCAGKWLSLNKLMSSDGRSIIEKYIQSELDGKFSNLNIIYNDRLALNGLELDIYIPDLRLAFELNGICHYEPVYGVDSFEKAKRNDKIKVRLCYEKGIELAVINTRYNTKQNRKQYFNIIYDLIKRNLGRLAHIKALTDPSQEPQLSDSAELVVNSTKAVLTCSAISGD